MQVRERKNFKSPPGRVKQLTLFEDKPWLEYACPSIKEWQKELKNKVCIALIKQGFVIEFCKGVVAKTEEDFRRIVKVLEELGVKW
jgi:hypothetical protein